LASQIYVDFRLLTNLLLLVFSTNCFWKESFHCDGSKRRFLKTSCKDLLPHWLVAGTVTAVYSANEHGINWLDLAVLWCRSFFKAWKRDIQACTFVSKFCPSSRMWAYKNHW
jgi:hypothetical protein